MSMIRDVEEFQVAAGQRLPQVTVPMKPSAAMLETSLLLEEFHELVTAMQTNDIEGVADGGVDLIYVVLGTLLKHGITPERFDRVWAEVQRSNMDKFKDGVQLDDSGKIMKPEGWTPPDIKGALDV